MQDNWALLYAHNAAQAKQVPLVVVFCLLKQFPRASSRSFDFMIKGLLEADQELSELNIPFVILTGNPGKEVTNFAQKADAGLVVSDFTPLRGGRNWRETVAKSCDCAVHEIDTHNIVPVWEASDKQEYAARTIRPKINNRLEEFLTDIPKLTKTELPELDYDSTKFGWDNPLKTVSVNKVDPVDWLIPGSVAAHKMLEVFMNDKGDAYDENRNDPNQDVLSNLSAYLHFGQISPQRVALEVNKSQLNSESKEAFLEQLIIRRELSDNFCFYNSNYDNADGFPDWAVETHAEHIQDKREYTYTYEEFENADTHDPLWNAAQTQMVKAGKMHTYLRMYWAKKILEWTKSPKIAMEYAVKLNDKYEIDGRDPNGYVGCAWSIGGVHDRPWFEREVFGKIRYMNFNGAKRKFDVDKYIDKWS